MAQATTAPLDYLSARSLLASAGQPAPTRTPVDVEIHSLTDSEALIVWSFSEGIPMTCLVSLEYEPSDPGVGISGGWWAHGECPDAVLDEVVEAAEARAIGRYEDDREYEHEDALERREYASEQYFEGGAA